MTSFQRGKIDICGDATYADTELDEIAGAFSSVYQIEKTRRGEKLGVDSIVAPPKNEVGQLWSILTINAIIFGPIAMGFFGEIGKDTWKYIKKKLAEHVSKKRSKEISIGNRRWSSPPMLIFRFTVIPEHFHFDRKLKEVEFTVTSNNKKVIASALDQIKNTPWVVFKKKCKKRKDMHFVFNPRTNRWNLKREDLRTA